MPAWVDAWRAARDDRAVRQYSMAKPSLLHDALELRREDQTVGKSAKFARHGEALGRTWVQTVASLDGQAVPAEEARNTNELVGRGSKADRIGYSLTWGDGGGEFGQLMHDKPQGQKDSGA